MTMTDLVYVPRKLVRDWIRKGWGLVYPDSYYDKSVSALLMHPPGWDVEEWIDWKDKGNKQ